LSVEKAYVRCDTKGVGRHGRAKNRPIVRSFAFPGHGIITR